MKKILILMTMLAATAGCESDGGNTPGNNSCEGGKCDGRTTTACDDVLVDRSGLGLTSFASINDTVSRFLMNGDNCPTTFQSAIEKMKDGETAPNNHRSMFVNETAQLTEEPSGGYRAVTIVDLDGEEFGTNMSFGDSPVVFSLFGLQAGSSLPQNAEVIGWDFSEGLFNYYEVKNGEWEFFGSSREFAEQYTETDYGDYAQRSRQVASSSARCGGCHQSGGLVMKELRSPWVHWEGDTTTPGVSDFFDANEAVLGDTDDGIGMESFVDSGNQKLVETFQNEAVANGNLKRLLRPLFCDTEFNLDSLGFDSETIFLNNALVSNGFFDSNEAELDFAAYLEAAIADGQGVFSGGQRIGDDTFFQMTIAGPSGVDQSWRFGLASIGADDEFANNGFNNGANNGFNNGSGGSNNGTNNGSGTNNNNGTGGTNGLLPPFNNSPGSGANGVPTDIIDAAQFIDFSRKVFSSDRCALLEFVPETTTSFAPEDIQQTLTNAFGAAVADGTATPAAEDFHRFLTGEITPAQKNSWGAGYLDACAKRNQDDPAGFIDDLLTIFAANRERARSFPVMEFEASIVRDNAARTGDLEVRFHPVTCELTSAYVSMTELSNPCDGGTDAVVCASSAELVTCAGGQMVDQERCFRGCRRADDGDVCVGFDDESCEGKADGTYCDGNDLTSCMNEGLTSNREFCATTCSGDGTGSDVCD